MAKAKKETVSEPMEQVLWSIAYDCRDRFLHINEDVIFFELIDKNDNAITEPNKIGKVVLTSYYLKEMPFY